jgi:hypothetical protein
MSIFNPDNVFDRFSENIPGAGRLQESYLREVARFAAAAQIPVTADVREERVGGAFCAERELFLVLTPTERRLRRYPSYHYGRQVGTTLNIGWYLVGQIASGGLGGWGIAGGASQRSMDDLETLIHVVHQSAVAPAIRDTALAAGLIAG